MGEEAVVNILVVPQNPFATKEEKQ